MAETMPYLTQPDQYKPESLAQSRLFEVVMIRDGVNDLTATTEDLKRIPVQAIDPISAVTSKEVAAVKGWRPMFAAPPGVPTEPEIMARRRALEGPVVDRSKI
jgi:hypothetical protein